MHFSDNDPMSFDWSSVIMQSDRISISINIKIEHHLISNQTVRVKCYEKLISKLTDNCLLLLFINVVWDIIVLLINF